MAIDDRGAQRNVAAAVFNTAPTRRDLQRLFWTKKEVNERLKEILDVTFDRVIRRARQGGVSHRMAAMTIGVEKVREGKKLRGLFP